MVKLISDKARNMGTSEFVELFIEQAKWTIKKLSKNSVAHRMLERHESIKIDGYDFSCWRELAVYRVAQYIQQLLPDAEVQMNLDGNNSNLELTLSNEEQLKLNADLYRVLHKYNVA